MICPGGGYCNLAVAKEGHRPAQLLAAHGIATAVLEYRFSPYRHPVPLLNAQRAIRVLRAKAIGWGFRPNATGIMGFSACGHLAASAATAREALPYPTPAAPTEDPLTQLSALPDFAVLTYPVVSFTQSFSRRSSGSNLLGSDATPELLAALSIENRVSPASPPCFLAHTNQDPGVPPENSVLLYQALRRHGVPAQLLLNDAPGHGFGLGGIDFPPLVGALLQRLDNRR